MLTGAFVQFGALKGLHEVLLTDVESIKFSISLSSAKPDEPNNVNAWLSSPVTLTFLTGVRHTRLMPNHTNIHSDWYDTVVVAY